ncbi:MAG: carboxylating nicotinate-nucleotide diphosphorylase [Deltaproteobacteria bacterium]|nr:carboxylating nicotinate-nucleotide diphosphorylase [Deltaproteobacteria bacterium]
MTSYIQITSSDTDDERELERPPLPPASTWTPLVEWSIEEDLGHGDVSSQISIPETQFGTAIIEAREELVVCGTEVAASVFTLLDPCLEVAVQIEEGEIAEPGDALLLIDGSLQSILAAERTALNFLMRMCGVASWTRRHLAEVVGTDAWLLDTRKTLPGWRALDKYATAVGGAHNHRVGLFDGILLKDNHVAAAKGVAACVRAARSKAPAHLRIEIEVESEEDAVAATEAGADILLLDNMNPSEIRQIVEKLGQRVRLEASGGIGLDNLRAFAETGVHQISLGCLTHSAPAVDIALELSPDDDGATTNSD